MFKFDVKTACLRDDRNIEWSTIVISPVSCSGILVSCFDELCGEISMFRSVDSIINEELGIYDEEVLVF